jgi:Tfp pilus assembly protein PilX
MIFTPATDASGNYVVVGQKKYGLNEGVIASKNATYLGDLINTPAPAVNNGMIVTLKGGTVWTVTGTSYLTSLTIDDGSIVAPEGSKVVMTVSGAKTEIQPGKTYTGNIVLTVAK